MSVSIERIPKQSILQLFPLMLSLSKHMRKAFYNSVSYFSPIAILRIPEAFRYEDRLWPENFIAREKLAVISSLTR